MNEYDSIYNAHQSFQLMQALLQKSNCQGTDLLIIRQTCKMRSRQKKLIFVFGELRAINKMIVPEPVLSLLII